MNKENEYIRDRKLFSELFEPPTHPLLFHMVPPFKIKNDSKYCLQINGEVLYHLGWKVKCGSHVF